MAPKARKYKPGGDIIRATDVSRKIPFYCVHYPCDVEMFIISMDSDL